MSTAQIVFLCLMSIPVLVLGYMMFWGLLCECKFGLNRHRQLYKGALTNKQFDTLLYTMYSAKDLTFTGFEVKGGGYTAWIANDYYGFKINGVDDFSLYQRIRFFRVWKKVQKLAREQKTQKALDIKKLDVLGSANGNLIYGDDE